MDRIKKVILIFNENRHIPEDGLSRLLDDLTGLGCSVSIFEQDAERYGFVRQRVSVIGNGAPADADAALVLGGDGSILEAERRLRGSNVPIVGINYGHLGYLTEFEASETDLIKELIGGSYYVDERMMLDASVYSPDGTRKTERTVLNDIVITNGPIARLISFDLLCDSVKAESLRADGVIIATPTGSTAYSLSAGGPVLDPSLDGICVTPICPHTLNSRPTIFNGGAVISIKVVSSNYSSVYLNADGRDVEKLEDGDTVVISKSVHSTRLLRVKERAFVSVLRNKLSEN